jgi:hypothetical protein
VGKYIPTHNAWRSTTALVGGGVLGNLRFRKAIIGKAVPVIARTLRKKNSQRGPTVGRVKIIR